MGALGLAYPALGVHPDDEYLLGDVLLVAPVVTVPAPLTKLPLYLREGALLPLLRATTDTLAPATAAGVDSFASDAGLLFVRVAPGPASALR